MNILYVTLGFYPAVAWGGPVRVVYQDGRELVRRGHRVTVYCTNLLNKKERIRAGTFEREMEGMRVVYFHTWNLPWWPGTLGPIWLPDLSAYLEREISGFDVVHLQGYRCPILLPVTRAARRAGIPIVTQPQGTLPVQINHLFLKRVYDRIFGHTELEGISALIALQESERQQALSRGVPADRIEMIPNGIDAHKRDELPEPGSFRRRFRLASDRPLILFLGRINTIKGTDMLIRAFAKLANPGAQLAIVGPDDGQWSEVESLIGQFGLGDRTILTGLVSDADKMAAFQDADLFVLPSRYDAFPTTVMEACLASTPMVVTDCCEIAHLIRDRVADVVPFDADALASGMERLLEDHERYARYRANCEAMIADTFSIGAVVDRLEVLYRHVVDEMARESRQAGMRNALESVR